MGYFFSQLSPEALANWNRNSSRTRELYCDYMASSWSRKMRFLRALDTVGWARENALEAQVHKSPLDGFGFGAGGFGPF